MNVGYVRLSRDDDKKNYVSIENQMLIIRQYASERNIAIDRWYEDDGVSGYLFDRPGLNQLMKDLDQDIDTVFVKDFSRLGRHNAKVLLLLDEFQERGKRLVAIDDTYDSINSDDDTIGIKTWYNERYVKDTSKKIRRALHARQKEGTLVTQPPFGYRQKEKAFIEIVPEEAAYIKMIYDLYLKGSGYRKIAVYLTENQVPTPSMARRERELEEGHPTKRRAASQWSDAMVKEILDNDFYTGTFRLHKRERIAIHGKDRRVPKDKQHIFKHHHPPVIDQTTFDLVQEVKEKRIKNHYRGSRGREAHTGTPHLFGNCLFCKDCGSRLTPIVRQTSRQERKYYICNTYNTKGRRYCSRAHLIEEQDLADDVINYIQLCRDSLYERIAAYDRKNFQSEITSSQQKLADISKKITDQKQQLKSLFSQKVKDLAVSPENQDVINETYASLQQDLLASISNLTSQLEKLNSVPPEALTPSKKLKMPLDVVDAIVKNKTLDRRDVEILIERITVDENGLPEIEWKYGLSQLLPHSPSKELNRCENDLIYESMKFILADGRGYTSAAYLSAKLTDAGYKKSKKSILPYIGLMIHLGVIEPSGNCLKPYTVVKSPDEIKDLMANFSPPSPSHSI